MPGKLPIDRVRETRQNTPKIYDEHRERFSERQAELRDADAEDPVAGARPDAAQPESAAGDHANAQDRDRGDDA